MKINNLYKTGEFPKVGDTVILTELTEVNFEELSIGHVFQDYERLWQNKTFTVMNANPQSRYGTGKPTVKVSDNENARSWVLYTEMLSLIGAE